MRNEKFNTISFNFRFYLCVLCACIYAFTNIFSFRGFSYTVVLVPVLVLLYIFNLLYLISRYFFFFLFCLRRKRKKKRWDGGKIVTFFFFLICIIFFCHHFVAGYVFMSAFTRDRAREHKELNGGNGNTLSNCFISICANVTHIETTCPNLICKIPI